MQGERFQTVFWAPPPLDLEGAAGAAFFPLAGAFLAGALLAAALNEI
jgi:hypothetical protein